MAESRLRSTSTAGSQAHSYETVTPGSGEATVTPCSRLNPCWTKDASSEAPLPRFIRPEWVIVYVTIAYSILTWGMLLAIKKQADTMEQQAKDSRASASAANTVSLNTLAALKEQGDLMKRQADAMDMQNKAIRDRERARITLVFPPDDPDFEPKWTFEDDEGRESFFMGAAVAIHNDGLSKAFSVRAKAGMRTQPRESPFVSDVMSGIKIPEVIRDVDLIDPVILRFDEILTVDEIREARLGSLDFYVYGEISYTDVFEQRHVTPFRFLWDVEDYEDGGEVHFASGWVNQSPRST